MNAEFRITQNAAMRPHPYERDERAIVMPAVSTHAALRYAERFLGIDLDKARRSALTPDVVSAISAQPTGVVYTPYGRLIVNDGSVVAVLPANTPVPQKRPSVDGYRTPGLCQPVLEQQALLRYLELDGLSDQDWRERIGNAVPSDAAQAIADTMYTTLLLAASGETFMLSSQESWVRLIAMALTLPGELTWGRQ